MSLERMNEAHPLFKNIAGSVQNHSLDSYTVAGDASVEYAFEDGRQIRIRKVQDLKEVSRTSFPADPGATINGMFFVKFHKGGCSTSQEETEMETIKSG